MHFFLSRITRWARWDRTSASGSDSLEKLCTGFLYGLGFLFGLINVGSAETMKSIDADRKVPHIYFLQPRQPLVPKKTDD